MKRLKKWQLVVLSVVILGLGGGAYGVYSWANGSGTTVTSTSNVQLSTVQYASLVNTVSSSGNIAFPNKKQLTFGSAGTVAEVKVTAGDTVKAGQTLATFDYASTIPLGKAVTQAKINLKTALDTLDSARHPYSADDPANAQTAVAAAQQQLNDAQFRKPLDIADVQYSL